MLSGVFAVAATMLGVQAAPSLGRPGSRPAVPTSTVPAAASAGGTEGQRHAAAASTV
jgi:hypothetical protein